MKASSRWLFSVLIGLMLLASSGKAGIIRCETLVDQVLPHGPSFKLTIRAGAKTTESLEAHNLIYSGIFFEVPLIDPEAQKRLRLRRQEKERLLQTIAALRDTYKLLSFKRDLLEYHRQRIRQALEGNEAFLETKEEILRLESRLHELEARLKAFGISREDAISCRW